MLQFCASYRFLLLRLASFSRALFCALLVVSASDVLAAPGQLDLTFGRGGTGIVRTNMLSRGTPFIPDIATQTDDKIILTGACGASHCAVRYGVGGDLDADFGDRGFAIYKISTSGYTDIGRRGAIQEDGKIVVVGECESGVGTVAFCTVRFETNGSLDTTYGSFGRTITVVTGEWYDSAREVVIQSDGKIVVSGNCYVRYQGYSHCLVRYRTDGSLDAGFGAGGKVIGSYSGPFDNAGLAVQSDGKILVATSYHDVFVTRFHADGSLDASYGTNGTAQSRFGLTTAYVTTLRLQANGKLLAVGACGSDYSGFDDRICLARFDLTGRFDTSFGTGGVVVSSASGRGSGVRIQADRKIVVSGTCQAAFCVERYTLDGASDLTFGNAGRTLIAKIAQFSDSATGVALQADGKIVVGGKCDGDLCLARFEVGPLAPPICAFNADANLVVDAPTDSLLILRYLLGYRGNALTNGVLGTNPTRTGQALETYLSSLNLDADGDGQVHAMTDGLLILRAMLGLSGDSLTVGAVNTTFVGARNAQQILTWIETTHGVGCLP